MFAVLFGSISSLADSSELQREAFNQAFREHGLSWEWDPETYRALLEKSGGRDRVAEYARSQGETVDAEAVHATKSALFQRNLATAGLSARPGVAEVIAGAKSRGWPVGLVTSTARANVTALLDTLEPQVRAADFDVVVAAEDAEQPKPAPEVYRLALDELGREPGECVAVEDNLGGVEAARAAGITVVAFPNENTRDHDFGDTKVVRQLEFGELAAAGEHR
ncbi:HAD-IA family hydrolase [Amycolatopsis sp. PS_44_ISF1]|uniref:HAD family hydrolase n=1 Tax=Amycolatopsis sp. PS_44_ISF1 TaxID=2974917 RepID=UPI0028DF76CD|nr:HAD-IA family hydrolase [Amycolatopsis sp. PS_44_ISF1]MDT8914749.1 HAD-IA family hydrolase [Amycolatopsis sp. PS_44_ISF1]